MAIERLIVRRSIVIDSLINARLIIPSCLLGNRGTASTRRGFAAFWRWLAAGGMVPLDDGTAPAPVKYPHPIADIRRTRHHDGGGPIFEKATRRGSRAVVQARR